MTGIRTPRIKRPVVPVSRELVAAPPVRGGADRVVLADEPREPLPLLPGLRTRMLKTRTW